MARPIVQIGGGIVHADAHGAATLIAAMAAADAGCAFVLDLRELVDPAQPFGCGPAGSEAFRTSLYLTIAAAQRAQRCLFGTKLLYEALAGGGVSVDRIELVPDLVEPVEMPLRRDAALADSLGLEDAQVFGFAGSLHAMAGLDGLVNILDRLRDSHPHLRLLLAGGGRVSRQTRDAIAALGLSSRAVIVENLDAGRVAACQSLIDVAAFPLATGIESALLSPRDIIAALGHGRAVVASRTRNAQEFITDGHNGLLREPRPDGGFPQAIVRLLGDPDLRGRIGAAALSGIAARTSPAAIGAQLDRTYRALFQDFSGLA